METKRKKKGTLKRILVVLLTVAVLIGFALLAAFFAVIARPVLRAFYARGAGRFAGTHALCALAVAALATGMMESAPLGAMTPMNTMLCLALAMLAGAGREVRV